MTSEAERLIGLLRDGAQSIDTDGTPSQVGPSANELRRAADRIEALAAENGRLWGVMGDAFRDEYDRLLEQAKDQALVRRTGSRSTGTDHQ